MTILDQVVRERRRRAFEKRRTKLVKAFEKAMTPQAKLRALAALTRQHGEYLDTNMLTSGWVSETVVGIADRMEEIAESMA
jgi:hypothetical protein